MQKFLFLLLLLGSLGIDLYLPVIPPSPAASRPTNHSSSQHIPLFIGVMGIGQLIAGPRVDYFGRRPLALDGVALYGTGVILAAAATLPMALRSVAVLGAGGVLYHRGVVQLRARQAGRRRCGPRLQLP